MKQFNSDNRSDRTGLIALLVVSIGFALSAGEVAVAQTKPALNPGQIIADKARRIGDSFSLSSAGDHEGAIEVLEGLVADYPKDKQVKILYCDRFSLLLSNAGDHEGAVEVVEGLVADYPKDKKVKLIYFDRLKRKAVHLVTRGFKSEGYELHRRVAMMARELAQKIADDPDADSEALLNFKTVNSYLLYKEACAWAYIGEDAKCIESLKEAVRWGFDNLNFMLNDMDLLEVTDRSDVRELLGQDLLDYESKLSESAKERLGGFRQTNFEIIFPDTQGNPRRLSEHGDQLKVVTFWATENTRSHHNLQVLKRLSEHFGAEKVAIVTVGCETTEDTDEAAATLRQFMETKGISLECLVANSDARNQLKRSRGFPTTLLVDGNGRLRMAISGAAPYHLLKTIVNVLLNESKETSESQSRQDDKDGSSSDGQ